MSCLPCPRLSVGSAPTQSWHRSLKHRERIRLHLPHSSIQMFFRPIRDTWQCSPNPQRGSRSIHRKPCQGPHPGPHCSLTKLRLGELEARPDRACCRSSSLFLQTTNALRNSSSSASLTRKSRAFCIDIVVHPAGLPHSRDWHRSNAHSAWTHFCDGPAMATARILS